MRPTLRTVFMLGAAAIAALLLAIFHPSVAVFSLAAAGVILVLFLRDAVISRPGTGFDARYRLPQCLYIGVAEPLEVAISLPPAWMGRNFEMLCDVAGFLKPPEKIPVLLAPGHENYFEFPLEPYQRGAATVRKLWLRWQGPLSLASWTREVEINGELAIIPNVRAVKAAAIELSFRESLLGMKPQSQQGEGTEFVALREYTPGLDHRSIDWKRSARHMALVCKEFQTERNHQIILAFDTGQLMSEPLGAVPRLDHAVNAGLLLAFMSLKSGDRIGMMAFDSKVRLYAEPVRGIHAFPRIQHMTANLEYRHDETNFTLALATLMGRLNRRSLIILPTEFVDTITAELMIENIQRLARRHLVVFVTMKDLDLYATAEADPARFHQVTKSVVAGDFIRERKVVLEKLRRMGVHCIDAPPAHVGADLVNRYLAIKRQELI